LPNENDCSSLSLFCCEPVDCHAAKAAEVALSA